MAASGVKSNLEKQRGTRRKLKICPRTNLNGGDLVRSTFLVLTFAFALAFMATFVLALVLAFLSPIGGRAVSLPRTWTFSRRSTTTASIRYAWGVLVYGSEGQEQAGSGGGTGGGRVRKTD